MIQGVRTYFDSFFIENSGFKTWALARIFNPENRTIKNPEVRGMDAVFVIEFPEETLHEALIRQNFDSKLFIVSSFFPFHESGPPVPPAGAPARGLCRHFAWRGL